MKKISRWLLGSFILCLATATAARALTVTTLANFTGATGLDPLAALVQGIDGNLYGTTFGVAEGTNREGSVFKVTLGGALTALHIFDYAEGTRPSAGLMLAPNGILYGATTQGDPANGCSGAGGACGTLFKITSGGALTILHKFDATDGSFPSAGLVLASNGNFFGTTSENGANGVGGTIFKIASSGLTTLYNFCSVVTLGACTDGSAPTGLIQGFDGNLYGTTGLGGTNNIGTIFKVSAAGLTTLHSFAGADGERPDSGLTQGYDGNLYGTTSIGGANNLGTAFKITTGGVLTTLHVFVLIHGANPSGLVQGTDGNIYGTTMGGGAYDGGTIFRVTHAGKFTTLYNFGGIYGIGPSAGLLQATDGNFYGTTTGTGGGTSETVFKMSVGLNPFVETVPTVGKVGASLIILGNNLTGATSVTFNGTAAAFTVLAPTVISATVPAGATTGSVEVTTPTTTLSSNWPYRVL